MPVQVKVSGQTRDCDEFYVRVTGVWRRVVKVYARAGGAWHEVSDYSQGRPTNLRGLASTRSTAHFEWDAPAVQAGLEPPVSYKVYRWNADPWTGTPNASGIPTPPDGTDFTFEGLAQDRTYGFRVVAVNDVGVESGYSNLIKYSTGHDAVVAPAQPQFDWIANAGRSDTWTQANGWTSNGIVQQGHITDPPPSQSNAFGCVHYGNVYTQFTREYDHKVAQAATVHSAVVRTIHRQAAGAAGAVRLDIHAGQFSFANANVQPNPGPVVKNVSIAELENATDVELHAPWADIWLKSATPEQNGLIIRRVDGGGSAANGWNGYCKLRPANTTVTDWQLKLRLSWPQVTLGPAVAAGWV